MEGGLEERVGVVAMARIEVFVVVEDFVMAGGSDDGERLGV